MFEELAKILDEQLHLNGMEITPESRIKEDLGADSLDLIDLAMSIEDEFEIELSDDAIEHIKTVGDMVSYIEDRI